MKILHTVESYLPARHGMSEVVRQISERLVQLGHQVTVATSNDPRRHESHIQGVEVRSFDVYGKSATGIWGNASSYQNFLIDFNPDIIVNFAAQQWATDLALPLLSRLKARKVFVPTGFSALANPTFHNYFSAMREWMRGYDACVFLSDSYRDIDFARSAGIESIAIIPNGAAAEEFDRMKDSGMRERLGIPKDHQLILHVAGYLSIAKGQADAIDIFSRSSLSKATLMLICPDFGRPALKSLLPKHILKASCQIAWIKGLRLFVFRIWLRLLCCLRQKCNNAQGRQIKFVSLSRKDTTSAFLDADLLLFPSRIECSPLVLFEAAAAQTPFLVTDVGNASEIIRWTGGGRLLPGVTKNDWEGSVQADLEAGARCLDDLMADQQARKQMATSAHEAWLRHFTWSHIAEKYEQLYSSLLAGEPIQSQFSPPSSLL
jgi:glycosyltransferase involved in cell wall biosynthesis